MIKIVYGDLLEADENIIAHQVNCQGKMGSGVALQIKNKYPIAFKSYKYHLKINKGYALGTNDYISISYTELKWVVNMFGQDNYGYDGKQYTNLTALESCLKELREYAEPLNLSVALPYMIGSDRGGADWKEVEQLILSVFDGYEVTLYKKIKK